MSTESTNIRLDTDAKTAAYAVFKEVGLKPAQAFNLFLRQVAIRREIPFSIKAPNKNTAQAINELEAGQGERFESSEDFLADLES